MNLGCATRFNWLFIVKLGKNFDSIFFFTDVTLAMVMAQNTFVVTPIRWKYTFNGKLLEYVNVPLSTKEVSKFRNDDDLLDQELMVVKTEERGGRVEVKWCWGKNSLQKQNSEWWHCLYLACSVALLRLRIGQNCLIKEGRGVVWGVQRVCDCVSFEESRVSSKMDMIPIL